jgi:hypothetical protein
MSEERASERGTPKIILGGEPGQSGGRRARPVTLDTNQLDPVSEAAFNISERLIQPRFLDSSLDSLLWVCGSAFTTTICLRTAFLSYFAAPFLVMVLVLIAGAAFALRQPALKAAVMLRISLIGIGFILGGLL